MRLMTKLRAEKTMQRPKRMVKQKENSTARAISSMSMKSEKCIKCCLLFDHS